MVVIQVSPFVSSDWHVCSGVDSWALDSSVIVLSSLPTPWVYVDRVMTLSKIGPTGHDCILEQFLSHYLFSLSPLQGTVSPSCPLQVDLYDKAAPRLDFVFEDEKLSPVYVL